MYFLFGYIFEAAIRCHEAKIPVTRIFWMVMATPISSVNSVVDNEHRCLLVCQAQTLAVLSAPAPSTPLPLMAEFTHRSQ
jgi:hypothetical protein